MLPFVITIPHASNRVPLDIKRDLCVSEDVIESSWDVGSMEIFSGYPVVKTMSGLWSRIVVDLNRSPRFFGPRGVVPHIDYSGRRLYLDENIPTIEEKKRRIKIYYDPFHQELQDILNKEIVVGILDCHTLNGVGPKKAPDYGKPRKDVILGNYGDKFGEESPSLGETTCDGSLIRKIKSVFEELDFEVAINDPYPGGYIVVHYGRYLRKRGGFGIQIELNQDMFVDPKTGLLIPAKIKEIRKRFLIALNNMAALF